LDLQIPDRYTVVDKIFLEPFWHEFNLTRSYLSSAVKNVIGFVPLGFCFYAYMIALRFKRAAFATVVLGTALSVTIEVLQAYLPTRDSGTTDIFTNALGTWVGVAAYNFLVPRLPGRFAQMFAASSCELEYQAEAQCEHD
jgi:glycopeptide antibiotics resistance protein